MRYSPALPQPAAPSTGDPYRDFLAAKMCVDPARGVEVDLADINPILKPHQARIVQWAVAGGRRAIFAAFGLGKSVMQLETLRLILDHIGGGRALIVCPLGVRQEFVRDAAMLGLTITFIRRIEEADAPGLYCTNYETIRDGKLDPRLFDAASLDEASVLRGFGGTKTFREFMRLFDGVRFKFVATATPSPNQFIEMLAYAAFLEVMDVGQGKTRFFKRNSEKADTLTLHPHKEQEFWLWVSSWATFVQRPSDLGCSDEGYDLPPIEVRWHEIPADHRTATPERDGQGRMFRNAALGVVDAAREKRDTLPARIAKLMELRAEDPDAHRIIWHDLEAERRAIEAAIPSVVSVYGSQDLDEREERILDFSDGKYAELATKPVLAGSGCNFQRHCSSAVFLGIGFKFNDFIQAIHRIQRFLQTKPVRIDLIYSESEREIRRTLEAKWARHTQMVDAMTGIIREHGLAHNETIKAKLARSIGVTREEETGTGWRAIHNDCVDETARMDSNSVDFVLTSIPFSTQYEYTPSYNDFGHTDDNAHFWRQMDFLTPELMRVVRPGRVAAIHVKDRITPGGLTGLGFQTVQPFSDECVTHFRKHGWAYLARKTVVTDVVRENAQTYRLGYTEQCKDGSRMGAGMPEYVLLFRKPPTDSSNGYADVPVVKRKEEYTRGRWQFDAHGMTRSSGDRRLMPSDLVGLDAAQIFRLFRTHSFREVYDNDTDVAMADTLDAHRMLPPGFILLQPQSHHPDVWTDITRMRTLNMSQEAHGKEMHLCLARDSLVLTRERGYVPIQTVMVGEHALTHRGRWRRVIVVRNTGLRAAVTVRAQGVGLTLTPDHKLWARKTDCARERDGALRATPGWTEARDCARAYLNLKLPDAELPTQTDPTLWWVVGRWLADGHIDARGCSIISCGKDKWPDFIARIGAFGGNTPHVGTAMQIQLRDPGRKLRAVLERCGSGAGGKHLPAEAYTLPMEQAEALLDGYLAGDGHFLAERQRWTASSISRELLLGVAHLAQRVHGAIASIYAGRGERTHVIEGRTVHARQEWGLSFDLPGRRTHPFILADGAWKKVRSIEDAGDVDTWNLRVEEDESFTAEGCIVKNCPMQFDIADRLITQFTMSGETVYDPFAGLHTVPERAVRLGRFGIGCELGAGYWKDGVWHLRAAERDMATPSLLDLIRSTEPVEAAAV